MAKSKMTKSAKLLLSDTKYAICVGFCSLIITVSRNGNLIYMKKISFYLFFSSVIVKSVLQWGGFEANVRETLVHKGTTGWFLDLAVFRLAASVCVCVRIGCAVMQSVVHV